MRAIFEMNILRVWRGTFLLGHPLSHLFFNFCLCMDFSSSHPLVVCDFKEGKDCLHKCGGRKSFANILVYFVFSKAFTLI